MAERRRERGRRVFLRYLLLQLPGLVALAAVLAVVDAWVDLTSTIWALVLGAWVLKDLALYPLVRQAYERGDRDASSRLVGTRGVARGPIDPEGWVRLAGELWRAELEPGQAPIEAGRKVRVRGVNGLVVLVGPDDPPA